MFYSPVSVTGCSMLFVSMYYWCFLPLNCMWLLSRNVLKQRPNCKFVECYEAIQTALHLSHFVVLCVFCFLLCCISITGPCVVNPSRKNNNRIIIITIITIISFLCNSSTATNFRKVRVSHFRTNMKGNLEGWPSNNVQLSTHFATNLYMTSFPNIQEENCGN